MITKQKMITVENENLSKLDVNNPLRIQALPDKTVIDFYMPNVIEGDITDYIDFLRAVTDARANDEVIIHINCYGGDIEVAFNIIDILNETQANVHISVEGACASAASMIMLAGDSWDIMPHAYTMCHAYSSFAYGKRQELMASSDFNKKWLDASIRDIYKNFLTPDEIDRMMAGEDFYFTAEETTKRLQNYNKDEFERQDVINKVVQKHQKIINDDLQKALDEFDRKHAEKQPLVKKSKSKK